MKKEFAGKKICFLGDSITNQGYYLYNLRSAFQGKEEKCHVFNRGVAGNRAIMAQHILEDEIFWINPDYVVVCFGVNDLGIWLYDKFVPVTDELLAKRKARDDEYLHANEILIDKFNERGIKTIIMSPYAVDELLTESDAIYTVPDNNEKEDLIKPSFYKRKTFENINNALKGYSEKLKEICEKKGAIFWDTFSSMYQKMRTQKDLFTADGIHYTQKGHEEIAKTILGFLDAEIPETFAKTKENDDVYELEQLERSTGFLLRCTPLNPHFGVKSEEEKIEHIKGMLNSDYTGGRIAAENYFKHYHEMPEIKDKLYKMVMELN